MGRSPQNRNGRHRASRSRKKAPVILQDESLTHKKNDDFQVEMARTLARQHTLHKPGSTGEIFAGLVFDSFPVVVKAGPKSKTQMAVESAQRLMRRFHPELRGDTEGIKHGETIARDCLKDAGSQFYGSGAYNPSSARSGH